MSTVRELFGLLFGRLAREGALAMLTAHYDDSGTHAGSAVLVMGGVVGNEEQWTAFEEGWRAFLAAPTRGRGPIKRFHMFDCENSFGEFAGWTRPDSDNAIFNARTVILSSGLQGYSAGIDVAAWDELVTDRLRVVFGDAERYAVTTCVLKTIALALGLGESEIKFVFDNRPSRNEANKRIHDLFQGFGRLDAEHPEIGDVAFLGSTACHPLQAADVVANEYYRALSEFTRSPEHPDFRPHWKRLEESGMFVGEMMTRSAIVDMTTRMRPVIDQLPAVELEILRRMLHV